MSDKEAPRPGLVQAALSGRVTNAQGAAALGLGIRQFRRMKAAYRRAGAAGLLHGNRGRPSSRRLPPEVRERIGTLMETTYDGLNDTHLTEKLREVEKLSVTRETVRQIRLSRLRPAVRRRRPPRHRTRRLREAAEGALVLIDGSHHPWFAERGPRATLLGAIDDATGRIVGLLFRPTEDLHGYVQLLEAIARNHGLPLALYGDRFGAFVRNDDHWTLEEQLAGARRPTQFGQMLADLAIGFIPAHSPQAKGRIERLWGTLQDRLVAELRLRRINTTTAANAYLAEFIRDFDQRFAVRPRSTITAWRTPPRRFARILACRYERTVAADNTVTLPGRWIQIPPGPGGCSYHHARVEVREQLDGTLLVLREDRILVAEKTREKNFTLVARTAAHRERHPAADALRPRPPRPRVEPKPKPATIPRRLKPAPNHPWRRHPERQDHSNPPAGGGQNHLAVRGTK